MGSIACKRYDVYWVKLDPARGSELRKTRPAVIVSLDVLNSALDTVVVCPLTSRLHPDWRTRLPVRVAGKPSEIAADQIRVISKSRLGKKLGSLSARDAAALRPMPRERLSARMKSLIEIRRQLADGQFEFSRHAFRRAIERNISEEEIRQAGAHAEIIEEYPDDKYSPSGLLLGFTATGRGIALPGILCGVGFDEDRHNL